MKATPSGQGALQQCSGLVAHFREFSSTALLERNVNAIVRVCIYTYIYTHQMLNNGCFLSVGLWWVHLFQ